MNPAFRLIGIAVLGIAAVVAGAGVFGSGKASAAATEIDCYFFNGLEWQCDISNPDGIRDIELIWHSTLGDIELWDETYGDCPTQVTIGVWGDHVMGDMDFEIEVCETGDSPRGDFGFKQGTGGGDRLALGFALETDSRGTLQMCWEAECGGDEIPWELVDPSCYAHEGSKYLPWCGKD
jgi:hypothetical protein